MSPLNLSTCLKLVERERTRAIVSLSQTLKVLDKTGIVAFRQLVLRRFLQTDNSNSQYRQDEDEGTRGEIDVSPPHI